MNKEEIIRMAWEAGIRVAGPMDNLSPNNVYTHELHRFADLIAAAEREECAKVCDDWPNGRDDVYSIGVAIRARGEK